MNIVHLYRVSIKATRLMKVKVHREICITYEVEAIRLFPLRTSVALRFACFRMRLAVVGVSLFFARCRSVARTMNVKKCATSDLKLSLS